jgi:hypothetical protein
MDARRVHTGLTGIAASVWIQRTVMTPSTMVVQPFCDGFTTVYDTLHPSLVKLFLSGYAGSGVEYRC